MFCHKITLISLTLAALIPSAFGTNRIDHEACRKLLSDLELKQEKLTQDIKTLSGQIGELKAILNGPQAEIPLEIEYSHAVLPSHHNDKFLSHLDMVLAKEEELGKTSMHDISYSVFEDKIRNYIDERGILRLTRVEESTKTRIGDKWRYPFPFHFEATVSQLSHKYPPHVRYGNDRDPTDEYLMNFFWELNRAKIQFRVVATFSHPKPYQVIHFTVENKEQVKALEEAMKIPKIARNYNFRF